MPRVPEHAVDPLFLRRWSPRAMSGASIEREALLSLLEAARWAPSSGNGQPWRVVYVFRDTPAWPAFFDCLAPGNQEWCRRAAALIVLSAQLIRPDGRAASSAPFDCGLACMALLLQGTLQGIVTHPMGGFDRERIRLATALAPGMEPQVMVAVGRLGSVEDLSAPNRERETPSGREPLGTWAREARWA